MDAAFASGTGATHTKQPSGPSGDTVRSGRDVERLTAPTLRGPVPRLNWGRLNLGRGRVLFVGRLDSQPEGQSAEHHVQ